MAAPLYTSEIRLPSIELPALQPQPLPPAGGFAELGEAIAKFGNAAVDVALAEQRAHDHTEVALATTDYLTRKYELEQGFENDADFKTAPDRFREELDGLKAETLGTIRNARLRARAEVEFTRAGIESHKRISSAAWSKEAGANIAALDAQELEALRSADAAGSPVERDAAVKRYLGAVAGAAATGYISPQQKVAREQRFAVTLDRADYLRVNRTDPEAARSALDDPKRWPALDPLTREQFKNNSANAADQIKQDRAVALATLGDPDTARELIDTIEQPHRRSQALVAIEHVARTQAAEYDRQVKAAALAARTGDDVLDLIKERFEVTPARIEAVRTAQQAAAARGDATAAKYLRDLDTQMELQPYVRRAWATSPLELDNAIKSMEGELTAVGGNATAGQVTALKAYKGVKAEIEQRRKNEPIVLGGEQGARFYRLAPIDPAAAPEDPALAGELARRGPHALLAAQRYGGPASVLTAEETRLFKQRFEQTSPDEQSRLLRTFGATLPADAYRDTVDALTAKDAAAAFAGRIAQERPELARDILTGRALMGAEGVTARKEGDTVTAAVKSKLGGQLYPAIDEQNAAIEAAKALYVARRGRAGALYEAPDEGALGKAIEEVVGPIVKRGSFGSREKVPVTPGIPAAVFQHALDKLDDDALRLMGGARNPSGSLVAPSTIANYAILKPLSVGGRHYVVGLPDPRAPDGFAPFMTRDFEPLVFDMRALTADRAARDRLPRPPSSMQELQRRRRESMRPTLGGRGE